MTRDGRFRLVLYDPDGWRALAACSAGPSSKFFSPSEEVASDAKKVCMKCPVRPECLAYALSIQATFGVWGGLDPAELASMRRTHSRPESLILGPDEELMGLLETLPGRVRS